MASTAGTQLPMLDINGEPFPWPFDIVIEILKHVAAEDPINLYPQLCTVSKSVAAGLHANKDVIFGAWLSQLYPLSARHVELMRSRYPDDDTTYVALVRDATLKVHEYLRKDPARLFKDARRFGMGPRGAKVYVAAPGEEVECWCEKILWTSNDWPYVIHQLWVSVGDEAQAGLHNGIGAKAARAQYQGVEFKLRAPQTPGAYPVSLRWNMHYTYDQAIEGYVGRGDILGWIIVPGAEEGQAHAAPAPRYFREARPRRTSQQQPFHFARMSHALPSVGLDPPAQPPQQTVHTFNIGPIQFNITVGPMRVTWGAGDDHGQDDNDDMGGPGSGLVDGGLAPRRG